VELSNELAKRHELMLCSFKPIEDWMIFPKRLLPGVALKSLNKGRGFDLGIYKQLYGLLKAEKPDVVHFHLDATIKYVLPFVILFPRIKFVHTLHSDLNSEKRRIFSGLQRFRFLINKVKLICISPAILSDFQQAFSKFNFQCIANGIEPLATTDQLSRVEAEVRTLIQNEKATIFVSVGRLDENKNQLLLVDTFNRLSDLGAIHLIIGTDPSPGQHYLKQLQAAASGTNFFLGAKTHVADYLHCADAFIMGSHNEGLPISALEAMAAKLPIITTPAGGLKDLVKDGQNGIVAVGFSLDEMTGAVKRFLELDPLEQKEMGAQGGRIFTENYRMQQCANNYLSVYN
jgi:glycosyltransferase involved in cell wall biosynthesis